MTDSLDLLSSIIDHGEITSTPSSPFLPQTPNVHNRLHPRYLNIPLPHILDALTDPLSGILHPAGDARESIAHGLGARGVVDCLAEAVARGADNATDRAEESAGEIADRAVCEVVRMEVERRSLKGGRGGLRDWFGERSGGGGSEKEDNVVAGTVGRNK